MIIVSLRCPEEFCAESNHMIEVVAFNDATYHNPGCWSCGRDLDLIMSEDRRAGA